jgi:type IV pilus assembly protein PilE
MKRQNQRGMTLMELLTVVAILGIIASIAVPSYRRYLVRAQRSEAKTVLLQLQAAQERYYLKANRYASSVTDLGLTDLSPSGCYKLAVDAGANQGYLGRAIPTATCGQTADTDCSEFQIDSTGKRSASGTGGAAAATPRCWR